MAIASNMSVVIARAMALIGALTTNTASTAHNQITF
jgi:hypothetical protein